MSTALIIDDEPDIRELLEITLGRMGIKTQSAENVEQATLLLSKHSFDLCLTDMKLPDGNGIELVKLIQEKYSHIPVAVITAFGSMEAAISALKAGAFDFVSKPVDLQRLRDLVNTALKLNTESFNEQVENAHPERTMLGNSAPMVQLQKKIKKLSRSQAPVFINGESGTGKELVARLIHEQGPKADQPFIPVNCGAIPSELMESEFFGHKKGAFTGATENKVGFFQAADGGTLFLDEVGDLPLSMQVKLLRVIQEKSVRLVGDHKETDLNVRILSATHKDLAAAVEDGTFRQDLFYRINVIDLQVPPLKDRGGDIQVLADHILKKLAKSYELPIATLTQEAKDALGQYSFPGNVRELENILERAYTLCEDDCINQSDLNLMPTDASGNPQTIEAQGLGISEGENLEEYLESIEKEAIKEALEETKWNKTAAAKKLGITFRALRYRLKKLDMD